MIDIRDNDALAELCERMREQSAIALDTEFIRERTYYPVLALVQVAWKSQVPVLIDPLTINDWQPFHDVLRDERVCKVFHAGRQDLEIFFNQMDELPKNVFDTQVAASMTGLGDQIGYSNLVSKLLNVQLSKGSSYTNWLQRPLSKAQDRYAREDVLYLPALYERLVKRAKSQKRLHWIEEELTDQYRREIFDPDPDILWMKIKRAKSLKPKDAAVLRSLAKWRDDYARSKDKPPRFLISDEALVDMAKLPVLNADQLRGRRGLQKGFVDRHQDEIIGLHREARELPKSEWPQVRDKRMRPPTSKSESLAELAWLLLKELTDKANIAPNHLILKKELPFFIEAVIRDKDLSQFAISHGWRREMVGQPLKDLIHGRLVVRVENHRIVWEETKIKE